MKNNYLLRNTQYYNFFTKKRSEKIHNAKIYNNKYLSTQIKKVNYLDNILFYKNNQINRISKKSFCIYTANKEVAQKKYSFAIVGSGPGGFYSAKQILKKYPNFHIDIYEKLPHPYGLVRTGIAPDHQDAKMVEKDFAELIKKSPNEPGAVNFHGNVEISKDLTFDDIKMNYSGVIFSYGASEENQLNLKNEDNFGCFSARNFVNWYNGKIDHAEKCDFMSPKFNLNDIEDVVVIGNGNVAIDVTRILSKSYNDLKKYDIPEKILEKLSRSRVKNIHVIARRGLVQSAFSVKELRELSKLENVNIYLLEEEIEKSLNANSEIEMDAVHAGERRHYARKLEVIKTLNILDNESQIEDICRNSKGNQINIFFRFLLTPAEIDIEQDKSGFKHVKGIKFLRSHLEGNPNNQSSIIDNEAISKNRKREFYFRTNFILKSLGYKSTNIFPNALNFDNNDNVILNKWGVVFDPKNNLYDDVFTCGWVKRGAKGIVDSTLRDSYDTVNSINYLLETEKLTPKIPDSQGILNKLEKQNISVFTNEKWNLLDNIEKERGAKMKKIREKITNLDEMKKLIK